MMSSKSKRNVGASNASTFKTETMDEKLVSELAVGVYRNEAFHLAITSLVGVNVVVETVDGKRFEGILDTWSPQFELVLSLAHEVEVSASLKALDPSKVRDKIIFKANQVVHCIAANVDMAYATRGLNQGFATDSQISRLSSQNGPETMRELEAWSPDEEHSEDPIDFLETDSNGWDAEEMFRHNEKRYGLQSTYKPSLEGYTMQLEKQHTSDYKRLEAKAQQVAREIEGSSTGNSKRHDDDINHSGDEEDAFSAVVRPSTNNSNSGANNGGNNNNIANSNANSHAAGNTSASHRKKPSHSSGDFMAAGGLVDQSGKYVPAAKRMNNRTNGPPGNHYSGKKGNHLSGSSPMTSVNRDHHDQSRGGYHDDQQSRSSLSSQHQQERQRTPDNHLPTKVFHRQQSGGSNNNKHVSQVGANVSYGSKSTPMDRSSGPNRRDHRGTSNDQSSGNSNDKLKSTVASDPVVAELKDFKDKFHLSATSSSSTTQTPSSNVTSNISGVDAESEESKQKKSEEDKKEQPSTLAEKSTLNPNAKEFTLNPNAKTFVPSSNNSNRASATPPVNRPQTPATPTINPAMAPIYPANLQFIAPSPGTPHQLLNLNYSMPMSAATGYSPAAVLTPNSMTPPNQAQFQQRFRPNGNGLNQASPMARVSNDGQQMPSPIHVAAATGPPILAPGPGVPVSAASTVQQHQAAYIAAMAAAAASGGATAAGGTGQPHGPPPPPHLPPTASGFVQFPGSSGATAAVPQVMMRFPVPASGAAPTTMMVPTSMYAQQGQQNYILHPSPAAVNQAEAGPASLPAGWQSASAPPPPPPHAGGGPAGPPPTGPPPPPMAPTPPSSNSRSTPAPSPGPAVAVSGQPSPALFNSMQHHPGSAVQLPPQFATAAGAHNVFVLPPSAAANPAAAAAAAAMTYPHLMPAASLPPHHQQQQQQQSANLQIASQYMHPGPQHGAAAMFLSQQQQQHPQAGGPPPQVAPSSAPMQASGPP